MRFTFAGMNNIADPANFDMEKGQCVDICNCDLDDKHSMSRRSGFRLVTPGHVTSCWTSPLSGVTYCVHGTHLCTFNGTTVSVLTSEFTVLSDCNFEQVNNVVVFSDGQKIGIIDGSIVTRTDSVSDWVGAENIEQWVKDHAPADAAKWDGSTSNSNFATNVFKLSTLAGKHLCFYNGALYLAIGNFVYVTYTFDVSKMDLRYCTTAGFNSDVTMIKAVSDGIFVSTANGVYFLDGGGTVFDGDGKVQSAFTSRKISNYGAIPGTAVYVDTRVVPALQSFGVAVMWTSHKGIFAGVTGGSAINLSADKVSLPIATKGAAMLRQQNNINQYMVCFDTEPELFTSNNTGINTGNLQGTWLLNTWAATHSRYEGYLFNSLFQRGNAFYGSNKVGIFELAGDVDFGGVQELSSRINAFGLTPSADFDTRNVKRMESFYVQARCSGEMAIDYYADEHISSDDDAIFFDDKYGSHTLRAHPPRGLAGNTWQFKIKNVSGTDFTVFNIEPEVVISKGRTK